MLFYERIKQAKEGRQQLSRKRAVLVVNKRNVARKFKISPQKFRP